MAIEIKVPPLGESLVDAVVGQWLKSEGDAVSRGETILELETDKVNLDVTAEDDGVIGAIQRQEGDTVTVGEVLGTLEAGDGEPLADNPEAAPDPVAVGGSETETTTEPESTDAPGGPPAAQPATSAKPVAPPAQAGTPPLRCRSQRRSGTCRKAPRAPRIARSLPS